MNTRLLRMACRDRDGHRTWIVPGKVHAFRSYTGRGANWEGQLCISFPDVDHNGEVVRRGGIFWMHGKVIFCRIRHVLQTC